MEEEDVAAQLGGDKNMVACLAACLNAPKLLVMPPSAVRQRVSDLEGLLGPQARRLSLKSPALLLVPWRQLEAKLRAMSRATCLDLEACASMITMHMFSK